MLLLFCLFCCCLFLLFVLFFRDSNMISIGTVEFRYYVVIIIPVDLGKPSEIRDWGSLDWSAFDEPLSLKKVCGFQTWTSFARFLRFVFYFVRISDQILSYYFFFYFISYTLFLTFTLRDFCVPIKHGFLNVSLF